MRFDIEWRYVRRHTLVPGVSAAIALGLMVLALSVQGHQAAVRGQLEATQVGAQEDYDALIVRRRIIDSYHRRYEQFSALGFVGMESRLDWIEALRASSRELTLPHVSYVIQPQLTAISPVESVLTSDDISVHVSNLNLEMSLVHELDLLRYIDELQRVAPGLIKVDACELAWQPDNSARLAPQVNILANCAVKIFSVITSDVTRDVSS